MGGLCCVTPAIRYYSGHDGTILALFSAMGAHAFRGPQFASHVLLELHATKEGEYMVELEYDGVDVQIPGCAEECPLDDFIRYICNQNTLASLGVP